MKKVISLAICITLVFGLMCASVSAQIPDSKLLSTPYDLTVTQIATDDGHPYGGVTLTFKVDNMPLNVDDEDGSSAGYWLDFEEKIGNGEWFESGYNPTETYELQGANTYTETYTWGDDYSKELISFRVRMIIYDTSVVSAYTPWSNVATVGLKASAWATPEINKAISYGLVPDSINGDFTQPITREEFAELSVRLYEVYTGLKAAPAPDGTFSDCKNPEVLKANKLTIVNGVGSGKFDPKSLTNREQIAAMLNRAVKIVAPEADLSVAGAPAFSDEKSIASYFLENVRFMSKNGFIKGSNGKFEPKGTCTREMSVLIAVRVYEYYKK
ncbi:MAG: S-layer homology domain-containing protein, partial [Clostridiales bacterium]|nr:S-layer homology domain-containing protein [Clostridiales bacterium]